MIRFLISFSIALLLSGGGYARKSLDSSGAISAFLIGIFTFNFSIAQGMVLISFFISSSALTKMQAKRKKEIEEHFKEGGRRQAEILSPLCFCHKQFRNSFFFLTI